MNGQPNNSMDRTAGTAAFMNLNRSGLRVMLGDMGKGEW
jgi:hypothetical protein